MFADLPVFEGHVVCPHVRRMRIKVVCTSGYITILSEWD